MDSWSGVDRLPRPEVYTPMRLRDYPREITVGDNTWRVRFCRRIPDHGPEVLGLCHFTDKIIYIKLGQSPEERLSTFFHEVIHAFTEEYGIHVPHKLIYKLEKPLAWLFLDNLI